MYIEWKDEYSVGVARFDENHKKLCALINELSAGILQDHENESQKSVLKGLLEYTTNHFADEEWFMKEYDYPDLASHKQEHEEFWDRLSGFVGAFRKGATPSNTDLLDYLAGWFEKHITRTDKKYQEFFNSRGVT